METLTVDILHPTKFAFVPVIGAMTPLYGIRITSVDAKIIRSAGFTVIDHATKTPAKPDVLVEAVIDMLSDVDQPTSLSEVEIENAVHEVQEAEEELFFKNDLAHAANRDEIRKIIEKYEIHNFTFPDNANIKKIKELLLAHALS